MITLMLLLKRRQGMTKEEFRKHYETSHVALARKYVGHLFADYRRHYVNGTQRLGPDVASWTASADGDYDVITKIVFADQAAFAEFTRICRLPDVKATLEADEARFLDRPAMRLCVCEEIRTWTAADVTGTAAGASGG